MKKIIFTIVALLFCLPVTSQNASADLNFRYINSVELVENYINSDQALKKKLDDLEKTILKNEDILSDYHKYYNENEAEMWEVERGLFEKRIFVKMDEIKSLKKEFQQAFSPIIDVINNAINTTCEENKYNNLIDIAAIDDSMLIVGSKNQLLASGIDINPLILDKLNLPADKSTENKPKNNFAYINASEIYQAMPKLKKQLAELEQLSKKLEGEFEVFQNEVFRKVKSDEISPSDASDQLREHEQKHKRQLAEKKQSIFKPFNESIIIAVTKLAKAKKINLVLDYQQLNPSVVMVGSLEGFIKPRINLTKSVKVELGLQ